MNIFKEPIRSLFTLQFYIRNKWNFLCVFLIKKASYKQNILFPFLNNFTLTIQGVPEKMKPIFIPYFSKSILPVKRFIYQFLGIFFIHICVKLQLNSFNIF